MPPSKWGLPGWVTNIETSSSCFVSCISTSPSSTWVGRRFMSRCRCRRRSWSTSLRTRTPVTAFPGGTDQVINALVNRLSPEQLHVNQVVTAISQSHDGIQVEMTSATFEADVVISTLPPKLLVDSIAFSPALPDEFLSIASQTHTWMGESIKVAVRFDEPFWRQPDSSGTIFSNVGPVTEMYDHSSDAGYALMGFMNSAYHAVSQEERKELVLQQLRRIYGPKVDEYRAYHDVAWSKEPFTYRTYRQPAIPHQHNGHPIFRQPLFLAGSSSCRALKPHECIPVIWMVPLTAPEGRRMGRWPRFAKKTGNMSRNWE